MKKQKVTHYIYRILCIASGRMYIGQTKNPDTRGISHLSRLRHDKHHCKELQKEYNEFGIAGFRFELLQLVPNAADVDKYEEYWIRRLTELGYCLNRPVLNYSIYDYSTLTYTLEKLEYKPSEINAVIDWLISKDEEAKIEWHKWLGDPGMRELAKVLLGQG